MTHLIRPISTDGVPEYRPTLDGYYVPTDLGNIGRNINDQTIYFEGSPDWSRDDPEPSFLVRCRNW